MKHGKTSIYLTERVANLLDGHGPEGAETERNRGMMRDHLDAK